MTDAALRCAYHPDRETTLRCNRCEKPICTRCAVLTPVGYRCKECVRGQQAVFETARPVDFVVAAVVSAIGAGIAVVLLKLMPLFWLGLIAAPFIGGGLAEVVRAAVGRRRSRKLPLTAAIAAGVGVFAALLPTLVLLIMSLSYGGGMDILSGALWSIGLPLVAGGLLISALYYRLRGIRL